MKNYFNYSEFISTDTGLHNVPSPSSSINDSLRELRTVLNILRYLVGCPIRVNSAFRTKQVNEAVGGCSNSLHLVGRAADITVKDKGKLVELYKLCLYFYKKGILSEFVFYTDKNFIHIAI